MLLALPARHTLVLAARDGAAGALTLDRLDQQPLAFYHRHQNPWWHDEIIDLLVEHGAHPRITYRGLWAYDVLPEVNAGRALALVGTTNAADIALPDVTYVRLDPPPRTHLGLLWRHDNTNAAVEEFVQLAEALTTT